MSNSKWKEKNQLFNYWAEYNIGSITIHYLQNYNALSSCSETSRIIREFAILALWKVIEFFFENGEILMY